MFYSPSSRTSVPLWHGHHSPVPSSSSSVPMQVSSRLVTPLTSRWHRPGDTLQQKESAIKESRKQFHLGIGTTRPQYGHDLFQNLQPHNPFEILAIGRKLFFLRGLKSYPEAAYCPCRQCFHAPYLSEPTITIRQIESSIRPRALDLQILVVGNLRPPPEALLSSPASSRGTQAIDRRSGLHLSWPSPAIRAAVSCLSRRQRVT